MILFKIALMCFVTFVLTMIILIVLFLAYGEDYKLQLDSIECRVFAFISTISVVSAAMALLTASIGLVMMIWR